MPRIVRTKRFFKLFGLMTKPVDARINEWLALQGDKVEIMKPVQYWHNDRETGEWALVTYYDLEAEQHAAEDEDWRDQRDTLLDAVDVPF